MARVLVPDELWSRVEPLLPPRRPHRKGGRPWCSDRAALGGILLVLRTGLPWEDLPQELGCSGMTCWRRLRDWKKAGVWERLQDGVLGELGRKGRIDWSRASLDASSVPAKRGARRPARTRPTAGKRAPNTTYSPTAAASP